MPPSTPESSDSRRFPRFELLASVEIHRGEETLILPARNVSQGGIYLGSDGNDLSSFGIGHVIEILLFDAADESRQPVRGNAAVVRRDPAGMALTWSDDQALADNIGELLRSLRRKAT
ncbi:MAG TPA: PilZ domain-containing protein [Polyangia bacterium]|nr:PilZ domain-containing protein [Polyangia bacterium]